MGKSIIMHVDEAPLIQGELTPPGEPIRDGRQIIGDLKEGPWVHVNGLPPDQEIPVHSHDHDEWIYVLEGSLSIGERDCGPGTVVYVERDTDYSFTVGPRGVRFINLRQGLAQIKFEGDKGYGDSVLVKE